MTHALLGERRQVLPWFALAIFAAFVGCGSDEKIVSYNVPKETVPPAATGPTAPSEMGEPVDRMLAAILPEGGQAWIYKVVGPIAAVDAQAGNILKFIASVPPAAGANLPAWRLPEGWSVKPGADTFTLATIQVPAAGQPLSLTVSTVNWGSPSDMLFGNVNRWRAQMGLPAHESAAEVAKDTREMKAGERTMIVADLKGTFRRGGMGGPFSGGMMSGSANTKATAVPPGGATRPATGAMPADHPAVNTPAKESTNKSAANSTVPINEAPGPASPEATPQPPVPKFDAPASWSTVGASGMNRAMFRLTGGGKEALVTISNIPTNVGSSFTDPLANANMWRAGVGLPDLKPEQLADGTQAIEISGRPATLVRAIPGEDKPDGTVGAVLTHGDQVWFFKLKGARQLVAEREAEFLSFLKTIRFAE